MASFTNQLSNEPLRLKHWMVVDDDPFVLATTTRSLKAEIANPVVSYTDPLQALHALEVAPGSFQALVTDFSMPGMHGMELSRRARAVCSGLKVLMVSGTPFTKAEIANLGVHAFLAKPFTSEELVASLHTMVPDDVFPASLPQEPQPMAQHSTYTGASLSASMIRPESRPAFVQDALFVQK